MFLEVAIVVGYFLNCFQIFTVPTRSLETRERSLCKKPIFAAFPKIRFFTESIEIFFESSHNGWLLPEFFSDFYN
jgi:hypothetical protein